MWVLFMSMEENISNHGYIGTSILRIYHIYIGGYFGKKNIGHFKVALLKILIYIYIYDLICNIRCNYIMSIYKKY